VALHENDRPFSSAAIQTILRPATAVAALTRTAALIGDDKRDSPACGGDGVGDEDEPMAAGTGGESSAPAAAAAAVAPLATASTGGRANYGKEVENPMRKLCQFLLPDQWNVHSFWIGIA